MKLIKILNYLKFHYFTNLFSNEQTFQSYFYVNKKDLKIEKNKIKGILIIKKEDDNQPYLPIGKYELEIELDENSVKKKITFDTDIIDLKEKDMNFKNENNFLMFLLKSIFVVCLFIIK